MLDTGNFQISQNPPPICDTAFVPTIAPASQHFPGTGGTGRIAVTAGYGCPWTVTGAPAWVTLTSGASGTGSGTVTYTVAPNSTSLSQGVALKVANVTSQINQDAPSCDATVVPTLAPTSLSLPSAGSTGSIAVSAAAGCAWSVSGVPTWMSITAGATGAGNGTVSYTIAANSGAARTATLLIANQSFSLSQAGASVSNCNSLGDLSISGASFSGSLSSTSCTTGARGTSYYTDRYTFTGTGGQLVAFLLTSTAFDTYLYLKNPSGTVIASNDDGGGGTNSRIPATSGSFTLPAGVSGTYVLEVTSYGTRSTGAYKLLRAQ